MTQVRKANAAIFALALCGVFRTESQENYFSLNSKLVPYRISHNKELTLNTRQTITEKLVWKVEVH